MKNTILPALSLAVILVPLTAACGSNSKGAGEPSGTAHQEGGSAPTCADVAAQLAPSFVDPAKYRDPSELEAELTLAIARVCASDRWSARVRTCFAAPDAATTETSCGAALGDRETSLLAAISAARRPFRIAVDVAAGRQRLVTAVSNDPICDQVLRTSVSIVDCPNASASDVDDELRGALLFLEALQSTDAQLAVRSCGMLLEATRSRAAALGCDTM